MSCAGSKTTTNTVESGYKYVHNTLLHLVYLSVEQMLYTMPYQNVDCLFIFSESTIYGRARADTIQNSTYAILLHCFCTCEIGLDFSTQNFLKSQDYHNLFISPQPPKNSHCTVVEVVRVQIWMTVCSFSKNHLLSEQTVLCRRYILLNFQIYLPKHKANH